MLYLYRDLLSHSNPLTAPYTLHRLIPPRYSRLGSTRSIGVTYAVITPRNFRPRGHRPATGPGGTNRHGLKDFYSGVSNEQLPQSMAILSTWLNPQSPHCSIGSANIPTSTEGNSPTPIPSNYWVGKCGGRNATFGRPGEMPQIELSVFSNLLLPRYGPKQAPGYASHRISDGGRRKQEAGSCSVNHRQEVRTDRLVVSPDSVNLTLIYPGRLATSFPAQR